MNSETVGYWAFDSLWNFYKQLLESLLSKNDISLAIKAAVGTTFFLRPIHFI